MPHLLKNELFEILIDFPGENYTRPRFDQTGKIVSVKFDGITVSGFEKADTEQNKQAGKGFYNEFGIDAPIGFEQTVDGGWFHKIGVGLLRKEESDYYFFKDHKTQWASFFWDDSGTNSIRFRSESKLMGDYAYALSKEIQLEKDGFSIHYVLKNTGNKLLETNEYNHNFLAVNNEPMGRNYRLKFPFNIRSENFEESVNPGNKVLISDREVSFKDPPENEFFFSNLSGGEKVAASWELLNLKTGISIRENGNFSTNKINLWGCKHVISPELFYQISIRPGETAEWSRTYQIGRIT